MNTFLSRYLAGECSQVWAELQRVGETVQMESIYQDAWAVALETMRRVRHNLELLIPRLRQKGFTFGEHFLGTLSEGDRQHLQQIAPILSTPNNSTAKRLSALEEEIGILPLSLRAFYVVVEGVNLVGSLPEWQALRPDGIDNPVEFARNHPQFDWRHYSLDRGLDPLFVWSLDAQIEMLAGIKTQVVESGEQLTPYPLNLAPDYLSKYGIGGDGPYTIVTPCSTADALVQGEWHTTTFVDYLRICLRWAGMPGLQRADSPPYADVAELTRDFLSI